VAILSVDDGSTQREFPELPIDGIVRWSPDGSALDYIESQDGSSNIWRRPLDGGPPRQLTRLSEDRLIYFAWSRKGHRLAYIRGRAESDVVLFHRRRR
jgi:Tol biopolymer transport system component